MFDRVAGALRPLNSVMTAGPAPPLARARRRPGRARPGRLRARRLLRHRRPGPRAGRAGSRPGGRVVGCDFSEPMLDLAREKAAARGAAGVRFEWADALQLPYDAGRFDAVTVGFGVRNLADLDRGLREMARVLQPGRAAGRSSRSPSRPGRRFSTFYSLWFDRIVPLLGTLSGDPEAYAYLPESVRSFPGPARAGREDGRAPGSSGSATRSSPAGSSRSTAASPGDPPLGRTAAGHRGARRLEPLAAGAAGRGRGAAARAGRAATASCSAPTPRRPSRPAASGCGRCWSCSAPGRGGGEAAVRAATAIELVHMATLVHDDVLDAAPLRRGQPTVVATSGREPRRRHRRPALLARLRAARRRPATPRSIELLAAASVALARGELAQRQDAYDTAISEERYLERCRLKTATLFECACLLGHDDEALARVRRRDRPRLPAARRRPRRHRPARADRQGARHRPARRHRHPAADPRRRRRPGARATRPARPRRRPRPRRSATGSPRPARSTRSARGRWRWSPTAKRAARRRRPSTPSSGSCSSLVADGVVQRYS